MFSRIALMLTASVFLFSSAWATPTAQVRSTVDDVVRIVSDRELKKHDVKRRQALKKAISSIFDYSEMSRRSLGKHWNVRSAAEKKQFSELFATLLENSYAGKIESYNNEKIVYIKETVDGDHAEVKSKVVTTARDEFTLDYRLLKRDNTWVVYDVVIEGVSLVSNYRSQFNKTINSSDYETLVKKLQAKKDELKAP